MIDAAFALGDVETVRRRSAAPYQAGADYLVLHIITGSPWELPLGTGRDLAAGLEPGRAGPRRCPAGRSPGGRA